jgi:hypothetical protein
MLLPEHPPVIAAVPDPGASQDKAGVADAGQEPIGKGGSKVIMETPPPLLVDPHENE